MYSMEDNNFNVIVTMYRLADNTREIIIKQVEGKLWRILVEVSERNSLHAHIVP